MDKQQYLDQIDQEEDAYSSQAMAWGIVQSMTGS
jgi:hypothetical protein